MTMPALFLRHLCFTGPDKEPAMLTFEQGLNVLYGASDTGKSFVLEAVDFMMGGSRPLRDIPERVGYERILLGVETAANETFTLVRATSGGQFQIFDGLHQSVPTHIDGQVVGARHSAETENNLSTVLLLKIGLNGKRVRTNAKGQTRSLSFRDLCRFCLISEGDIQKQGSPIEGGQAVQKTAEFATFKLLLTGVDDGALISTAREDALSQSRSAKLEFIDELYAKYLDKLENTDVSPQDLNEQLEKLEGTIAREQQALRTSEGEYQGLVAKRSDLRRRIQNGLDRRGEIDEIIARFLLLDDHYGSDLARLEGIREAGSLVAALSPQMCPTCGAEPVEQHPDSDCDGNLEAVVTAADAEVAKITTLRRELEETLNQLRSEAGSFDRLIPKIRSELQALDLQIQDLGPGLVERRTFYTDLVEKRAVVRATLSVWEQIADLQARREELEKCPEADGQQPQATSDLSSTTLDQFAQQVQQMLEVWKFPDHERVYFDERDRDVVINGKRRSSRGKGMRAITFAAFTVGLLLLCKSQHKAHPGFVILDSPLLAYREPEGTEDDLTGTDVQDNFYEQLAGCLDRQIIVIENTDPPPTIRARSTTTFFSKNPHHGRYGFFPHSASLTADE